MVRLVASWILASWLSGPIAFAAAQEESLPSSDSDVVLADSAVTVFLHVNVVPMVDEGVLHDQTVVVREDRIVATGPADEVPVPGGATVIDGEGRFLLPGLWDAHVHLTPEVRARPGFGDAALYLAFGITSVVNLMGDSTFLDTRRRIASGDLLAPNLYTSGRHVNEPTINSPEEAVAEVQRQRQSGYDLIKFHEVLDPVEGYITTTGVDEETLFALTSEARSIGIPLLGHMPNNFGLSAALEARLSSAHLSQFLGSYFWPTETTRFKRHVRLLALGAAPLAVVLALFALGGLVALIRRRSLDTSLFCTIGAAATLIIMLLARREAASFLWLGAERRVWALTLGGVAVGAIALGFLLIAVRSLRSNRPWLRTSQAGFAALGGLLIAFSASLFWLPVFHRSTPTGLRSLARKVKAADVSVVSTLIVEDTLVTQTIPELEYLEPAAQRAWQGWRDRWSPQRVELVRRGIPFFESVLGALYREGVPILLGTDAMGFPLVVPGASLHREMHLLRDAGLTTFATLRAATIVPAEFLGVEEEVGTVEVGKRADLLLVDANPLQSLETLRSPAGVVVRGRWIGRNELLERLEALSSGPLRPQISRVIYEVIESEGLQAGIARYRVLRTNEPDEYDFGEQELNVLGYYYLRRGDTKTAIDVFALNVEMYPDSFNTHDSLGEAYAEDGQIDSASASYARALELNPDNANARDEARAPARTMRARTRRQRPREGP